MADLEKNAAVETADAAPLDAEKGAEIMEKYEKESRTRKFTADWLNKLVYVLCLAFTLYHLAYASGIHVLQMVNIKHHAIHVGLVLVIGFLLYPAFKKSSRKKVAWYDWVLFALSAVMPIYVFIRYPVFISTGFQGETIDIIMGTILILLVLECSRRLSGPALSILSIIFLAYGLFGRYLPGIFMHRGYNWHRIVTYLTTDIYGIYGTSVKVAATYIVLFIIFGEVMNKCGMGQFFNDIANALAGHTKGGPAKVAVLASGFLGSINGSAVANVVTTGTFTIPLMKKTGYSKEFAGSVEATASVGGQLLPPIMGAAAFLMAEITGIPYASIVVAAILPAVLYFTGIFLMVHFEGKRLGLKGLPKDSIPHFFRLLAKSGYLLIPVVILVICMNYYTAGMSACFAILFSLIISLIGRDKHDLVRTIGLPLIPLAVLVVLWQVIKIDTGTAVFVSMVVAVLCSFLTRSAILSPRLVAEGLQGGAGSSIGVAVACAMAGIISGVVSMTALGTTLVAVIVPLAQKSIFLALFCTMLACIVLGMGVPTTANYVIMATITAPILIKMGIPLLAAHMFVFYFGIVADITPPVALAAYAGSAIAHSNPLKTGITATKLAIGAFIIPYIFALNPSLLFIDVESVWALIGIMVTSIIGMAGIAMGMTGHVYAHVPWYMRIMLLAGGIFLIDPSPVSDLIGLLLIGIPFAFQLLQNRKLKATAAE